METQKAESIWRPAEASHPLASLQGDRLKALSLDVALGPSNAVGADYFRISLLDQHRRPGIGPAVAGLFHTGRFPGHNWVEIMSLAEDLDFSLVKEMLAGLAAIIPPGGHMMVEYESPRWHETELSLRLCVPPAATGLGKLLWDIGCGYGFKDWAFAEGWSEGPRKLQGTKAFNEEHARLKVSELAAGLAAFLQALPATGHEALFARARGRAQVVMESTRTSGANLRVER